MTTIVTRTSKGSALSHAEMDQNWTNLNADKIKKSALANNSILYKNNAGEVNSVVIGPETIAGRKQTGEIVALTKSEVIAMLGIPLMIKKSGINTTIQDDAIIGKTLAKLMIMVAGSEVVSQGMATLDSEPSSTGTVTLNYDAEGAEAIIIIMT